MTVLRCARVLVGVCLLSACGAATKPVATGAIPASYRQGRSAFHGVTALEYLPAEAHWTVVSADTAGLTRRLPLPDLVRERVKTQPALSALFELDRLTAAGVATHRPAGVAHVEAKTGTIALFVTLADAKRFKDQVGKWFAGAGDELRTERSGKVDLLLPVKQQRVAVVIRKDTALIVVAPARSARDRVAVRLANLPRAESLALADGFRRTATRLDFGPDLGIYLALPAIFASDGEALGRLVARGKQLESEIAEAKAKSNSVKVILLQRELRMLAASAQQLVGLRKRMRLLASLGTLAVSTAVAERSIAARARLAPPAGSAFATLLAPQPQTLALLSALRELPLLAVAGHMRVAPLLQVVEQLTAAQGVPLAAIKGVYQQLAGRSFDSELVPMLSGEIGMAVTEASGGRSGVDLVLGVRDRDAAKKLLVRLANNPQLAQFKLAGAGAPRFRLPSGGQQVYLGLAGNAIVATTDATVFDRLDAASSRLRAPGRPALNALLERPAHSGLVMVSGRLLSQLLAPRHQRVALRPWAERVPNIPRSKEYLRELAKLAKLDRQLHTVDEELERLEQAYYRKLGARFGDVVLALGSETSHITAYGGLFVPASLPEAVAAARRPMQRSAAHRSKLTARTRLLEQRDALWRTVSDVRNRDIAKFINETARGKDGAKDGDKTGKTP